jgi:flagellar L-ring protein precursor FlgH
MMQTNRTPNRSISLLAALLMASTLTACQTTMEKLENVGKQPAMSTVDDPTQKPDYKQITWPTPETPEPGRRYANSLWQPGARAFFRDQRAQRVGDILRVNIDIQDQAVLDNQTRRERRMQDSVGAPNVFGMEDLLWEALPGNADPANLLSLRNQNRNEGIGRINRRDRIQTQVAATVIQVLPNGNLLIDGKQEVRVNFELREVGVKGIVRREDISSTNTVELSQVAEARVIYGGRGQVTDIQQPRWGNQVIDALSPF